MRAISWRISGLAVALVLLVSTTEAGAQGGKGGAKGPPAGVGPGAAGGVAKQGIGIAVSAVAQQGVHGQDLAALIHLAKGIKGKGKPGGR